MIPAILSGGAGTRLWPVSRASFPKQFCELLDESLLQKALRRTSLLGSPWCVTTADLRHLTERTYRDLQIPREQILLEPQGRNTAPALALLCRRLEMLGKTGEIVGAFPADHLIAKPEVFAQAAQLAAEIAMSGPIVTLGVQPTHAATGFGYIETDGEPVSTQSGLKALPVKSFHEKPDTARAQVYLESGRYFWNAGMFVFKVSEMIRAFQDKLPEVWTPLQQLKEDLSNLAEIYTRLPSISIDYGVMEKWPNQVCIPCDMGWSDLGAWDDLARMSEEHQLPLSNRAELTEVNGAQGNFVFSSEPKTIGLIGVKDLSVIDTSDALLIVQKGQSQYVKNLVEELIRQNAPEAKEHRFDVRPWGNYRVLADESRFKAKVIQVDPGAQLSYQSHEHRSEIWVIVEGSGEVQLEGKTIVVQAGSVVHIPVEAKHRMRNTGSENLVFVEVQTGTYFGEDDIRRYEDDYGRTEGLGSET